MSECHDDHPLIWLLALLLLVLDAETWCQCDCADDELKPFIVKDENRPRPVNKARPRWSPPVLAGAFIGLLVLSTMIGALLGAAPVTATTAPSSSPIPPPSAPERPAEASLSSAPEPVVGPVAVVEGVPDPLAIGVPDPVPLPAVSIAAASPMLLIDTGSPVRFGVGSTLDQVIAAQGMPPTYSSKHGELRWWGSSKVVFSKDGHVQSWVNGTPALQLR